MDLYSLLTQAYNERFKADIIVTATEENVQRELERIIYKKYKPIPVFRNGKEYGLYGVIARIHEPYHLSFEEEVDIDLFYVCISKINKKQEEIINAIKDKYLHNKSRYFTEYSSHKIPLWFTNEYTLDLELALNGKIDLQIG